MQLPATRVYSAREFAQRLGYSPEDWGLDSGEKIVVMPSDQIYVGEAYLGRLTPEERENLERVPSALDVINDHRASIGLPPLDPFASDWTGEDLEIEASRLRRAANTAAAAWPAGGAFVGRVFGGILFTGLGRKVFGENEPMGILYPPVFVSRVVGQVLGASSLAAVVAPSDLRVRAALGAAAGAWVPYAGAPLSALGAFLATRTGRRSNPPRRGRRWMWITGGVVVALFLGTGVAIAAMRKRVSGEPLAPQAAIDRAIEILGTDASPIEVTDAAYPLAHPDCPEKLDPQDPTHATCIEHWEALYELAKAALPKKKWGPRPVPDDLPDEGPAADMRRWLDSLTPHQRSELRRIIGPKYYDPIKRSATAGDDGKTVGNVLRLKNGIEKFAKEDTFAAIKQYNELKQLLGPKLDELLETAKKYEGSA